MMAGHGLDLGRAFIVRKRVIQIVIELLLLWDMPADVYEIGRSNVCLRQCLLCAAAC